MIRMLYHCIDNSLDRKHRLIQDEINLLHSYDYMAMENNSF